VRTGRDLSPLLEPPAGGRRAAYASTQLLSRLAAALLLMAGATLAYQAYLNGVTIPGLVVMAVAVVASLAWLQRAYRNLAALGVAETRDSPASAVAWFLIPLANWVLTYSVLRDLYKLSDRSDPHGLNQSRPLLVRLWWLFWAAPPVASVFSLIFIERPELGTSSARVEALVSFDLASLAVASVLAALIIIRVTALQEASHRGLEDDADAGL
jgi:Domain of unknown function (DUF4328)